MWDLVSFMLGLGLLMLIIHYWLDPAQVIRDIKELVGSNSRVAKLEARVLELEKIVMAQQNADNDTLEKVKE